MGRQDAQLEPLLTARNVAALLALSPHTVLDMAEDGRLPSFKLGTAVRFRESEIADYIEGSRREVAA